MNINRFRVRAGDRAVLKKHRPDDTAHFGSKEAARERLQKASSVSRRVKSCCTRRIGMRCSWYVIPADYKWFAHALVAEIIVKTLEDLDLAFPKLTSRQRRELRRARRRLAHEG